MSNVYEAARRVVTDWHLGQTSQRYESSGLGAETISTGKNDHGGISYGAYQLSSKAGTLQEYLAQSTYDAKFKGLHPATPEFDAKWREIARTDPEFGQDQHDFIGRSHYQAQLARLETSGLSLGGRGKAVQDVLWSTSVQFRDLTKTIVSSGLKEKFGVGFNLPELTDRQIIEAVQDYKINHNNSLFKNSPGLWPGLTKRANSEKAALLELAECEKLVMTGPSQRRSNQESANVPNAPPHHKTQGISLETLQSLEQDNTGTRVEELQQVLSHLNYRTPTGQSLRVDGHFGPDTRHAVETFQREHALPVDGVVGKDTQAVLAATQANPFTNQYHPHHALYEQALHQVHAEESRRHIHPGQHSERLAGALTVEAARHGLTRIDRVELNDTGNLVRAVQVSAIRDEPGLNRTTQAISTGQATQQSIRHNSERMEQVSTLQHQYPMQQTVSHPDPSLGHARAM